jgi:hypothetical protein
MKIRSFIILILLGIHCISDAQSYRNETSRNYASKARTRKKVKEKVYKNNIVKLNLTGLAVKSFGLQYEHKIRKKASIALGLIYRPKSTWIVSKFYDSTNSATGISNETKFMYATSRFRTFMITPELRYYLGRQAPNGLYLSAFARARMDRLAFKYNYYDNNTIEREGLANLDETLIGGGIMLGYQIVTRKKLTIDFWFLGPWIGNQNVKLRSEVNANNISEIQQKFIAEDMKPLLGKEKDIQWNSKGIDTKFNYFGIGVRFFGINIGYSF